MNESIEIRQRVFEVQDDQFIDRGNAVLIANTGRERFNWKRTVKVLGIMLACTSFGAFAGIELINLIGGASNEIKLMEPLAKSTTNLLSVVVPGGGMTGLIASVALLNRFDNPKYLSKVV